MLSPSFPLHFPLSQKLLTIKIPYIYKPVVDFQGKIDDVFIHKGNIGNCSRDSDLCEKLWCKTVFFFFCEDGPSIHFIS